MKKNLAVLLAAGTLVSWTNVSAASKCSYEDLTDIKKEAANIKATFEEAVGEYEDRYTVDDEGNKVDKVTYKYFDIKFMNISPNTYIKVANSSNEDVKIITYDDTDEGSYLLSWYDLEEVTTFNYSIYTATNTKCPGEEIRKGTFTIPKYNFYYGEKICDGISDYYLCQEFITTNADEDNIYKTIEKYKTEKKEIEEKEENEKEKNKNSIGTLIAAVIFALLVCGGGTVLILKERRSKKNGKKNKK